MKMINSPLLSSKTDLWATPQATYDKLHEEFRFSLDAAANSENSKCAIYLDQGTNGLVHPWAPHTVWCNPPYGRTIGKWVEKAYNESLLGSTVVMLLPSRTDTKWFHNYCLKGEVRFIKGRLKFGNATQPAPFPSMVVVFRGRV